MALDNDLTLDLVDLTVDVDLLVQTLGQLGLDVLSQILVERLWRENQ